MTILSRRIGFTRASVHTTTFAGTALVRPKLLAAVMPSTSALAPSLLGHRLNHRPVVGRGNLVRQPVGARKVVETLVDAPDFFVAPETMEGDMSTADRGAGVREIARGPHLARLASG